MDLDANDPDAGRITGTNAAEAVSTLLSETERAHGVYETAELAGVYDQDWAQWYAAYAVDHGLGDLVGHDVSARDLAAFLASTFEEYKGTGPEPDEPWPTWAAQRIVSEL